MKIQELFESQIDKEVREFIKNYRKGNLPNWRFESTFPIHKVIDGKVHIDGKALKITNGLVDENGELMIELAGKCGQIVINCDKLTSFKGFPPYVSRTGAKDYTFAAIAFGRYNKLITSFEGFPIEVSGNANVGNVANITCKDIHKHIKSINGMLELPNHYKGPLLGVLKIEKLKALTTFYGNIIPDFSKAIKIVNTHLTGDRNIIACQEELFQNDLDEYAKL